MQEQSYLAGGKESEAFGSEGQARPTLRASVVVPPAEPYCEQRWQEMYAERALRHWKRSIDGMWSDFQRSLAAIKGMR